MWAAWIVGVSLTAVWPTVCSGEGGKSTPTAPALFFWSLHPQRLNTHVTLMPTSLALATGLDPKTITLKPVPTRDDPNPRSIQPFKTEPTPRWGLRVWFKPPPGRRYRLTVTLADGSTHTIDPWSEPRPSERQKYEVGPYRGIAPEVKRG